METFKQKIDQLVKHSKEQTEMVELGQCSSEEAALAINTKWINFFNEIRYPGEPKYMHYSGANEYVPEEQKFR